MTEAGSAKQGSATHGSVVRGMIRLARPQQWVKSGFVLIGPVYHLQDADLSGMMAGGVFGAAFWSAWVIPVLLAAAGFAVASSGLYVLNDLADVEEDRQHPRKRHRPIASGLVPAGAARAQAFGLLALGVVLVLLVPGPGRLWVLLLLGAHVANVLAYSGLLKRMAIVDVLSLSMGFVLRVLAGCAAIGIAPTTFLLNATLFVSMFLAFGKRLGERRTMGSAEDAARARGVQRAYSDHSLRMLVVATGIASLLIYLSYVQDREGTFAIAIAIAGAGGSGVEGGGEGLGTSLNLLWLTTLPAAYGLFRCFLLVERGDYDDPTELAMRDRPFQLAAGLFVAITVGLVVLEGAGVIGIGG